MIKVDWLASLRVGGAALVIFQCYWRTICKFLQPMGRNLSNTVVQEEARIHLQTVKPVLYLPEEIALLHSHIARRIFLFLAVIIVTHMATRSFLLYRPRFVWHTWRPEAFYIRLGFLWLWHTWRLEVFYYGLGFLWYTWRLEAFYYMGSDYCDTNGD